MNKLIKTVDYNESFNPEVQKLFIEYLMSDPTAFTMCRNILHDKFFDSKLSSTVRMILEYAEEQRGMPSFELIKAKTGVNVKKIDTDDNQRDYFLSEIEKFCRYKALQAAIIDGAKLLEKGEGGEIERLIKDAMAISLTTDLGLDYFHNPKERLKNMMDNSNYVSTGWKVLDNILGGGFIPGTLNIFAGGPGSGKSLFLQNISLNWLETGKNIIYISLELSEGLIGERFDAMISKRGTKAIYKDIDETAFEIISASKKAGKLHVKRMRNGSNTNDIRAYVKEYEIKTGRKPDGVVLDYLDLLHPNNRMIDVSNLFVKDKYTSEEFRDFLEEFQFLSATASQLGRSSFQAQGDIDMSHIAGGVSKLNTADNAFSLYSNALLKEQGKYEATVLKGRTSDSVGEQIEFSYNRATMRISDPIEEDIDKPASKASLQKEFNPNKSAKPSLLKEEPAKENKSVLDIMARLSQKNKEPSERQAPS